MPGAVPILNYQVPQAGTMVSHPTHDSSQPVFTHAVDVGAHSVVAHAPSQFDVTDRVRLPRMATPTNFVRAAPRRKGPIIALALCAAAAGGIATFIAFGGGSTEAIPAKPPTVATPAALRVPVEKAPTPAPTPAPAPIVEPPPPSIVTEPPPPVAEPAPAKPAIAKKPPVRPRPHPTNKPKPEEKPAWDADSPFMPVRTDKH